MSITALIRKQRWLAHTVAVLVLGLSGAPALARMQCLESGHASYAIGDRFDCCADEHPDDAPVFRATCCELAVADPQKADYVQQLPTAIAADVIQQGAALFMIGDPFMPEAIAWLDAHRPPLPLDLRLARIGSLLL